MEVVLVAVESHEISIGTPAPDFTLRSVDGEEFSLASFAGSSALLVAFVCNHCPYVQHIESELGKLTTHYAERAAGGCEFLESGGRGDL